MSDPKKTEASYNLPFLSNVKETQSFLDRCNYPDRFTSWLASLATPLMHLIKKVNAFALMPSHHVAFQAIINEICRHTTLKDYRPDLDTVLECDASKVAMGMTHMQDFNQEPCFFGIEFIDVTHLELLDFASKILTPTQQCQERDACCFLWSWEIQILHLGPSYPGSEWP